MVVTRGLLQNGSIRILDRKIGELAFVENGESRLDLKMKPNLIRDLLLHLRFNATIVTGDNINADFPFGLIRNIQIRASNGLLLKTFSAYQIAMMNKYMAGTRPDASTIGDIVTDAATDYHANVKIPFELLDQVFPEKTVLNTNEYNELTLVIQWGSGLSLTPDFDGDNTLTVAVIDVIALERLPIITDDNVDQLTNRQRVVDSILIKDAAAALEFLLPENTMIKELGIFVSALAETTGEIVHVNNVVNARVTDNNEQNVIMNLPGVAIKSRNKEMFGLEALEDGFYLIPFGRDHDFSSILSTIGTNFPKLNLEIGAAFIGDTTTKKQVFVFVRQIVTPAATTR